MRLVQLHGPVMLRIARSYVGSLAVAEEVVQEAWLGILQSLPRLQGRSSLKTWVLRILKNIASPRAAQEHRSVPFSGLEEAEGESGKPALGPSGSWTPAGDGPAIGRAHPGGSVTFRRRRCSRRAALAVVESEMLTLPPNQRAVIELRDVEGWDTPEVCELLEISEANQRVLLHRARSRVRRALECISILEGLCNRAASRGTEQAWLMK